MGYCVASTGLWDRGYELGWSALRLVVFAGWVVKGGILRVAQNDKGDSGWWLIHRTCVLG
jgi:hypothetical protein